MVLCLFIADKHTLERAPEEDEANEKIVSTKIYWEKMEINLILFIYFFK